MKNNRSNKGWMMKIWLVMLCMNLLILTGCAGAQPQFVMVSGTDRAGQTDGNVQSSDVQESASDGTAELPAGQSDQTGDRTGMQEAIQPDADGSGRIAEQMLYVHVCGAVQKAGVYALPVTARVFEALEAAGGCTDEAAQESVNQARLLTDGEELYIPTRDEILSGSQTVMERLSETADEPAKSGEDKININTADVTELTLLNGIGASRAQAIIDWREKNGGFSSIEEIKNIDGIADKTYEKLKDRITVN